MGPDWFKEYIGNFARQMRFFGMTTDISDTMQLRIDPARNMRRYYSLSIQPDLFGGYSLMRTWGRIGSGGQIRVDLFEDTASVRKAHDRLIQSKQRRGYHV